MSLVRKLLLLFLFGLFATLSAGTAGYAATSDWIGDSHAAVRLITRVDSIASDKVDAGIEFRFADGWHGYWRTPGDAGIAPQIDWSQSSNIADAYVTWPAPHRLVIDGLQNSIYEGQIILPVQFRIKDPDANAKIAIEVTYAACSDVCVPYHSTLSLPLRSGAGTPSAEAALFAQADARVPTTPQSAGITVVSTVIEGEPSKPTLKVLLRSSRPFAHPDLFVEGAGDGIPAAPEVALEDGGRSAHLTVALPLSPSSMRPLTLTLIDWDRAAEFSMVGSNEPTSPGLGTFAAVLSALLGGLILNLMPCVLPVLSIKLFAFTRYARDGLRTVRLGAMASAAGITFSFVLIALSLIVLKSSGAALGWGIQFQQPWFLAGMAVLTTLFAASFFDLLPISTPFSVTTFAAVGTRHVLFESFLVGAFATLLATPCSAPFVGTAVGFALTRGPSEILIIFFSLGIGMSLPYLMAAIFPGSVKWLPRPGRWMMILRGVLGVLLLGTAAWLLFVLWRTAGDLIATATTLLLIFLLGFRSVLPLLDGTILNRWSRSVTTTLAVAPLALSIASAYPPSQPSSEAQWQRFDPVALQHFVDQGKTVLVDVTATWCLTCKLNEAAVFDDSDVRERLRRSGIVRMRADWTRSNPEIAAYLQRYARFGIPLDVVYGPNRPHGEPLPELLTPAILKRALDDAAERAS